MLGITPTVMRQSLSSEKYHVPRQVEIELCLIQL